MLFVRLIAQPEVKRPKRTYCSAAPANIALSAVTSVAGLIECAGALVHGSTLRSWVEARRTGNRQTTSLPPCIVS
jgi:hypothetical protein